MEKYNKMAENFLKEMIPYQTVNKPGNEKPLARFIADQLEAEGFAVEIQEIAENRANVVARMGDSDRKVILSGHLDVVPAGDGWSVEPFAVTEQEGKLYGRGTCDMKGGIAAMMAAAIKIKREGRLADAELVLAFVADEEIDGTGTKHFAAGFEKGRDNLVVLGEPTGNQIFVAHRGVVRLRIVIKGRQCHSGCPGDGINALTMMGRFLVGVDRLNQKKQGLVQPILPAPTVAATRAGGGIRDNVVPGTAEVILDFRTVPGDTAKMLMAETDALLNEALEGMGGTWTIEPFIDVLPGMTPVHADSVQVARAAYRNACNADAHIGYFAACCDMSCFTSHGFDTIIMGPGDIAQAHTLDEYVEREQLSMAVSIYEQIVLEFQSRGEGRGHDKEI